MDEGEDEDRRTRSSRWTVEEMKIELEEFVMEEEAEIEETGG